MGSNAMRHAYVVSFEPIRGRGIPEIRQLVARTPGLVLDQSGEVVSTEDENLARRLFQEGTSQGFCVSFWVSTFYSRSDALSAELGRIGIGPGRNHPKVSLLPNAFEGDDICQTCGSGATLCNPHVLSQQAVRFTGKFLRGAEGTGIVLMRSEIAKAIMDATDDHECMRHPVTRSGDPAAEWMEPVSRMTMPELSRKSEGVLWGASYALSDPGAPPENVEPCEGCGRPVWDKDLHRHTRLVYPPAAVKQAQQFGVVSMYEAESVHPEFDANRRRFTSLWGFPRLLYTAEAIEVLSDYIEHEDQPDRMFIEPVFSA